MSSHRVEAGDLRDRPKHRSSCSMAKEDRAAATVVDGSALPAIHALPNRNAISKAPRAAGYRGSDFVLCIIALVFRHSSARDIDDEHDSSVAALVLGRHVGCVRTGLPKSNRRQLTWLHAGMDKML
jgi:hypothetical protein